MTNDKLHVIELLELFLAGKLDSAAVLSKWPDIDKKENRVLFPCWEAVYHYNTDSDIRAKDPSYDEMMRREILRQLETLKSSAKLP